MNKLFPLLILNESRKFVKEGKTTIEHNPSPFSAVDDNSSEIIDNFLKKYDLDIFTFLWNVDKSIKGLGFRPWLMIMFEKEYRIPGHLMSIRRELTDCLLTSYSRPVNYSFEQHGFPTVSTILVKNKSVLKYLAKKSEIFKPAWECLKKDDSNLNWVFVSDPPIKDWLKLKEKDDGELFLKLYKEE